MRTLRVTYDDPRINRTPQRGKELLVFPFPSQSSPPVCRSPLVSVEAIEIARSSLATLIPRGPASASLQRITATRNRRDVDLQPRRRLTNVANSPCLQSTNDPFFSNGIQRFM